MGMKDKKPSEFLKELLRKKGLDPRYYLVRMELPNSVILIDIRDKKSFVLEKR